jgi:hypothetical protein
MAKLFSDFCESKTGERCTLAGFLNFELRCGAKSL